MLIEVCSKNFIYRMIDKQVLDDLIEEGEIFAFRRSAGWVIVDEGSVRDASEQYSGPERRREPRTDGWCS